jgi:A/G-specific adenine glycosylase
LGSANKPKEDQFKAFDVGDFVAPLLLWFQQTARDLPWRRTYDPYHVWISEIMLQQTQMERGVAYFLRWMQRFPSVQAVAAADLQEIFKHWEGLGYYARARNLHKAAKVIVEQYAGQIPSDYQNLLRLPGIGPYSAAAIASIAGGHDIPVVDTNVMRVFARLFDIDQVVKEKQTQTTIFQLVERFLPSGEAREYNQALMEFGGLVCLPKNPHCPRCPLSVYCRAYHLGTVAERPRIAPGKQLVALEIVAGIIRDNGKVFIQQRPQKAVWGGLWEFPGGELQGADSVAGLTRMVLESTSLAVHVEEPIASILHQYTHHKILYHPYLCRLQENSGPARLKKATNYQWVSPGDLGHFAFPAGPRKLLDYLRKHRPDFW